MKYFFAIIFLCIAFAYFFPKTHNTPPITSKISLTPLTEYRTPNIEHPTPSPTKIPPLTFSQMNSQYGPCVYLPVLYYHHVESLEVSKFNKRTGLAVTPETMDLHLKYISENGYKTITVSDLINFFDHTTPLPKKSVLLTFDDGYEDMNSQLFPLLKKYDAKASIYLPTGLMGNSGYLSWDQIMEMKNSGLVYFGNHTWSHKTTITTDAILEREIKTADHQLADHGLNIPKTFIYPYGQVGPDSFSILNSLDYKLAFTTKPGSIQCAKNRLILTRTRMGNLPMQTYLH